ncbi:MAG: hypothetical protein WAW06_02090 [bacterium]
MTPEKIRTVPPRAAAALAAACAVCAAVCALGLALVAGCGGKYEKPVELSRTITMGEYSYLPAFRGFENATSLSVSGGSLYVAFADTLAEPPSGTVKAYFSGGEPIPENLVRPFTGLQRPTVVGAGKRTIAVADRADKIYVRTYGLSGGAPTVSFTDPDWSQVSGLAVDDSGNIYVADAARNFVRAYKPDGRKLFQVDLADSGFGFGHVMRPTGIAVDGSTLLISEADAEKAQVQRIRTDQPQTGVPFSATVPFIIFFTDEDGNDVLLVSPAGVAAGREGSVFILDRGLGQILRFDAQGDFVTVVNSAASGGPSNLADAVSIDTYNRPGSAASIYVLDAARGLIHRWDPKNEQG